MEYDKEKLREFYNKRGYIDFNVKVARGPSSRFSGFNINFIVSEGQRYTINNVEIVTLLDNKKRNSLEELFLKKGDFFNSSFRRTKVLINYFENNGYSFIRVVPSIKKSKNFVNIKFNITEGKYVNKIIIHGNSRTKDSVIRRELSLLEGDPFNKSKLNSSIKSIKRLGYFESVNYKLQDSNTLITLLIY